MPVGGNRTTNYLDEETCFKLWVQTGSLRRAVDKLASAGILHPEKGTPPTPMGVWVATIRYMARNTEEAREYLKAAAEEYHENVGQESPYDFAYDDNQYYSYIISKSREALGRESFRQLIRQFPEYASEDDLNYAR